MLIATDGGLKHNIGTFAFIFVIGDDNNILEGYNAETSLRNPMTSTREELLAVLSAHYILLGLTKIWGPPQLIDIKFILDSKPAIDIRHGSEDEYIDPMRIMNNEMDVEYEIIRIEKLLVHQQIMYQWVKGHQDISKAANKKHATLNKLVDELATKARDETLNGTREAIKCHFPKYNRSSADW